MRAVTLLGLGDPGDKYDAEIAGFLTKAPNPTSTQVADFLKLYSGVERTQIAHALTARGVNPSTIANALNWLDTQSTWSLNKSKIYGLLAVLSAAASGYHGYKRNKSIGWGAAWFVLGGIFPIFTPVIALAQGFGRAKS